MMKINKNIFVFLVTFSMLVLPFFVSAADKPWPFVRCGVTQAPIQNTTNPDGSVSQSGGQITDGCTFNDLLAMIGRIITFVLFYLTIPIAAIMFAYAGFLLLFSGGNTSQMQSAKRIFVNVALGLVIALAAWLIITSILSWLGYKGWNPLQ